MSMTTCAKTLCYKKYSKQQFLRKEAEIRSVIKYENEVPTVLEFLMLYIKMTKYTYLA